MVSSHVSEQVTTVTLPVTTSLLAVSVTNSGGSQSGWRGVIGNSNTFTDNSWKCSFFYSDGWQNFDFDDTGWPSALEKPYPSKVGKCAMLPKDAKWLWMETSYYSSSVTTIYCRKVIS